MNQIINGSIRRKSSKQNQVAEVVRSRIENGDYERFLPGQRVLAEEFGVTQVTIVRAIEILKEQGIVRTESGSGTYITKLKRPRTHTIGVIVHSLPGGPLHQTLTRGLHRKANELNQHLLINGHLGDPERALKIAREWVENLRVDGVLLWQAENGRSRTVDFLKEHNIPVVMMPNAAPNVYPDCSTVSGSDADSVKQLIKLLVEKKRTHIGIAATTDYQINSAFHERYMQYREEMVRHGLTAPDPIILTPRELDIYDVPDGITGLLRQLDAVFCITDAVAAKIMAECVKNGIRVPGDLYLTGYDNSPFSKTLGITTIEQNFDEIGNQAMDLLLDEIEGRLEKPEHAVIMSEVIPRESTEFGI